MNRTLSQLRRYDPELDRCLRELQAEHRLSNEDQDRAMGGLVAVAAIAAVVVAGVWAVLA